LKDKKGVLSRVGGKEKLTRKEVQTLMRPKTMSRRREEGPPLLGEKEAPASGTARKVKQVNREITEALTRKQADIEGRQGH